ncbi:glycerophosphodiester phosphodiesterase family protein [Arcticibacter eurypsychrophilus]|uniref:glycerophosphodiester phosphodiesterase family protein n=1 Tax=Arcticibacter eurypsychrophilus TaxID=1434752 RepID=UPI001FE20158|nr:glycerophosphodiester phosphodiesterase family protein [Arcticibacter eurypsychrophilus]
MAQGKIDIEGHRGCRGLMPENTIPAMKKAMDLGVTTLEMDIAISKDQQAVLSHDPFMSADFVLKPDGQPVTAAESKSLKIYELNYEEIRKFDVGSRGNAKFPKQQKMAAYKPLLSDLIDSTEAYARNFNLPTPYYNIETKVSPEGDGIYHPEPEGFMKMLIPVILSKGIEKRVIIQSFDPRTLEIVHRDYPEIKTALLVENKEGLEINLKRLSFKPTIYSPYYLLVDDQTIRDCHKQEIKIIPWTVNTQAAIEDLINKGVDGIITDYPDLLIHKNK